MIQAFTTQRYPHTTVLLDGSSVRIRPVTAADRDALGRFYAAMPTEDLVYMDRNLRSPEVLQEWLDAADRHELLDLAAEAESGEIVGHCLVYQTPRGWKSHQGRIRITVLPAWRHKAMASRLIQEMVHVALNAGLDLLVAEFIPGQETAMETFSRNSFHTLARIPQYVRDTQGKDHDLILMGRNLRDQEFFAAD